MASSVEVPCKEHTSYGSQCRILHKNISLKLMYINVYNIYSVLNAEYVRHNTPENFVYQASCDLETYI